MYGPSYVTADIRALISECVDKGNKVSSEKMGQSQISGLVQKSRDDKGIKRQDAKLSQEILDKIRELMEEYPNEKGNPIEKCLASFYGTHKPESYNRKMIMTKVNAWCTAGKKGRRLSEKES